MAETLTQYLYVNGGKRSRRLHQELKTHLVADEPKHELLHTLCGLEVFRIDTYGERPLLPAYRLCRRCEKRSAHA